MAQQSIFRNSRHASGVNNLYTSISRAADFLPRLIFEKETEERLPWNFHWIFFILRERLWRNFKKWPSFFSTYIYVKTTNSEDFGTSQRGYARLPTFSIEAQFDSTESASSLWSIYVTVTLRSPVTSTILLRFPDKRKRRENSPRPLPCQEKTPYNHLNIARVSQTYY